MMNYLVELDPVDPATGAVAPLRFSSLGFMTEPDDTLGNAYFEDRLQDAGNYERFMFGKSRTRGDSAVGGGDIQLINADGELDFMLVQDLAFDGRALRISAIDDDGSSWSGRQTIFVGTMEQAEFPSRFVTVRIRDRLALLREVIQTQTYLGTTVNAGLTIAEGNADLKDVRKPIVFGRVRNVTPVCVDQFDNVYQVSANRLSAVTVVRDSGVVLPPTADYPTLAALKAAAITKGYHATCLALGLVRTYLAPEGSLTVDAVEGATIADRSAARIIARMLAGIGAISASDIEALHAANPAECGIFIGTAETTILAAASAVLSSIGAYLTADRFGVFRIGRLELPAGFGEVLLDASTILGRGEAIARSATSDEGSGVPARSVTVRWGRNYTVFTEADLKGVSTDDAFRAFGVQEWRLAKVESAVNKVLHPKGPELVFDSGLLDEAAALAEANRLMAIYGARRDLFTIAVSSDEVPTVDLNDLVTVQLDRFGMAAGRVLRVIGLTTTYKTNVTEIEAWG